MPLRKIWSAFERLTAADLNRAIHDDWTGVVCSAQATTNCATTVTTVLAGALTLDGADPYDYVTAGAPSKFTVPAGLGGVHNIVATLSFPAGGAGTYRLAQLRKNGIALGNWRGGGGAVLITVTLNWTGTLAAGDVMDLAALQDSGGTLAVSAQQAFIRRIGAVL